MKQQKVSLLVVLMLVGVSLLFISNPVFAKVTGPCANCHTMHNSQGGSDVVSGGPYGTLLVNDCVGCHSSEASSTTYDLGSSTVPVVYYRGGDAPSEYLAGGNFWWVKEGLGNDGVSGDSKGHNVFYQEDDQALSAGAPGGFNCSTNCCHTNLSQPSDSAGWGGERFLDRYGCQGCHLYIRHHADDHGSEGGLVTTGQQGWYRFLARHQNDNGVHGYEDGDWEAGQPNLSPGTDDHNEYLGNATAGWGLSSNSTTTGFCTGCHGNFHNQESNGSWIRHPSDAYLPGDAQYGAYTSYDPSVPVARKILTAPSGTVTANGETDMVMCLSCHRPHGSPYPDILRWDYDAMDAGTTGSAAGTGCFVCHTNKDGS